MNLQYVIGDATNPVNSGRQIIAHCCNDAGYWNAGFVRALSARFHQPEREYHRWAKETSPTPLPLGEVQFVKVRTGLCVANIIGQSGIRSKTNERPIRYDALRKGLARIRDLALAHNASVHMPRLGAGLAGGSWIVISQLIESELCDHGVPVTVYDLPAQTDRI